MAIDFDKFLNWAEKRFEDIIVKGDEIKINSVFCEDYKHKMWCNPHGGKYGRDFGVYHCWKTDKKGTLVGLVMEVDKCTFEEAMDTLDAVDNSFAELEKQVNELFESKKEELPPAKESDLKLPPFTYKISSLEPNNFFRMQAETYLNDRKIINNDLFVCTEGQYGNRIVIPYYNQQRELIYWNARFLGRNKQTPKYLFPTDVSKSDVVYMTNWNKDEIYLIEGEFDAMTLAMTGLAGCAIGGKDIHEKQIELIRKYKITICIDNDEPGRRSLPIIGDKLRNKGIFNLNFIRPPTKYKDWNEMNQNHESDLLLAYIIKYKKIYDGMTSLELKLN